MILPVIQADDKNQLLLLERGDCDLHQFIKLRAKQHLIDIELDK